MSRFHGYTNYSNIWRNRRRRIFGLFLMSRYLHLLLLNLWNSVLTWKAHKRPRRDHPANRQNHRLRPSRREQTMAHPSHPRRLVFSLYTPVHHPSSRIPVIARLLRSSRRASILPAPEPRGLQCQSTGTDGSIGTGVLAGCAQGRKESVCLDTK